jgi:hypothetical protein
MNLRLAEGKSCITHLQVAVLRGQVQGAAAVCIYSVQGRTCLQKLLHHLQCANFK